MHAAGTGRSMEEDTGMAGSGAWNRCQSPSSRYFDDGTRTPMQLPTCDLASASSCGIGAVPGAAQAAGAGGWAPVVAAAGGIAVAVPVFTAAEAVGAAVPRRLCPAVGGGWAGAGTGPAAQQAQEGGISGRLGVVAAGSRARLNGTEPSAIVPEPGALSMPSMEGPLAEAAGSFTGPSSVFVDLSCLMPKAAAVGAAQRG
mmetsp:Transcript_90348/g.292443  ORF Transcript_90348/g.292443 Transcript_90348/m.292443 type:complete len:200 (+) Transcript_90348:87-686(+)